MRAALVCLLAALAVSASVPKPFQGQQSYVYRFDTQVASALIGASPNEIQQAAATRLRADVRITFTNDRHAKLQLQHVRIGELNGEMPKSQRVQPFEHFERREIPQELKQTLEMPLSISYVDGVVERINFHEQDAAWSKNIKRAVLNMIQLNLKRNDVQGLKMQSSMPQPEHEKNAPVFTIPEITLEGECETVYTVQKPKYEQQQQEEDEQATFNVTKTINFDKCTRTADIAYGYTPNPAQSVRCLNCLRQQQPHGQMDAQTVEAVRYSHCQQECQPNKPNDDNDLERSTVARFELLGKREKYVIKRTQMISQYVAKAQNPAAQNAVTQVIALSELTFKEQSDDAKMVPSFQQSSTDETLMYSPEWDLKEKRFYMAGDEEFEKQSPFGKVQKKEQKVAHALRSVLQQWGKKEQGYELDSALHFNRLVEVVRQSTVKEIRQIEEVFRSGAQQDGEQSWCQSGSEKNCQEHAKALFQDALAAAGTRNALYVLAEKIMKQQIPTAQAVQALQIFVSSQHSPSEQQADILERIAKHEVAHRSPVLKQTAWLAFGSAVGALCQDQPAQGQKENFRVEEICPRGKKEQYKKTLIKQWEQADSIYDQILALKAIGNAALDNTLEELRQIVKQQRQPALIRMEAIDAMRRLRTAMPQKIRQELLPIFQNQREQPEIRMAAFSMIMYTHPEKSVLDQLTFTVLTDRSQNVKSFVLTTMEALARSPSSAEQQIATHLKSALKMVKINAEQLRSSRQYRVPIYVSEKENTEEQNVFFGLASIVSPANMIPVHLSASLRSALNGEATENNLQIAFTQKNLEQLYEKMSDYAQQYLSSASSEEDKEGMERRSAKDLRSIYSSLGIKSRRTGSYFLSTEEYDESDEQQQQQKGGKKMGSNQPFGMIVLRANDADLAIVPVSEEHLPQAVRKMLQQEKPTLSDFEELSQKLASGAHFQKHGALNINEKKTKIPTSAGLPLALIRQTSAVASIEGQLKARFESENLDAARGLNVDLKLRTSGIATHVHKTEIWTPVLISGVESLRTVEINTPLEAKLRGDQQKVELAVRPPQEHKTRFFAIHTLPITFTAQWSMESRTQREPRVRTVHNRALQHAQREYEQGRQQEQAIQMEGHYHQLSDPKQILQALYTTENNVHFYFVPSEQAPKELKLRISGSAFQKHAEHGRPEMDSFYASGSKGFQPIYEEDFEGMDLEQDEQRQSKLSQYQKKYEGKNAYKHQLKVEAEARYPQKTHKIAVELKGACDSQLKHCKLFVDAERSPIHGQQQPWNMKAKIQTVAPEVVRGEEDPSEKQSRMLVTVDTEWGTDEKNTMQLRIQAEPTKKTMWTGEQQSGDKWARFLNKFDLVAEYKLHSQQKHYVQGIYQLLKSKLFWQLTSQQREGERGVVRATAVIDPISRRFANITVQTPEERVRIEAVPVPMPVLAAVAYPLERRPTNLRSIGGLLQSVGSFQSAECRADQSRVRTFDGVSYKAPLSSCWTVLAKDCSREEPRFVVLMKKTEEQKKVKIITRDTTIELAAQSENEKMHVKINGERVQDPEQLSEEGVELNFNTAYVQQRGIQVEFDGEEAKVKIGGEYKNLQCGLCGHYNEEDEDVFRMGNNQRSSSLKEFHRSYALKNEECDEAQLNKHYEQDSQEFSVRPARRHQRRQQQEDSTPMTQQQDRSQEKWQDSTEQKDQKNIKPVKRTQVIEYNHKICFSTEPVKRCPRGTTPDDEAETNEKQVQFFCMERSKSEGRRLLRQVRKGEIVESEGQQPAFVETVEQPTKCLAYGA
ncbi:hypothetical protein M3Y99_01841300 [Aphelenchoides fujianensis]|nr:hypothetical protein M3Y99_01841300 [Aphelenchoides fujianensis]